jgi:integrase
MAAGRFCGPLAGEFAAFAATLEASATASKTTLTQLRALDRYTAQRGLPSGTIDENLAKAWLADCAAPGPEPDGSGPRLHDLRATFAVTRLLLWYRDGEPVMARLPLLSTYLGHACISDTEVYLRITTALLQEANTRFHAFAEALLPAAGDQS